jgi:glutamate decarboxylase
MTGKASHVKNTLSTPYSSRYGSTEDIPKYNLPDTGINANAAYQLIHDELDFDGRPNLNLASFVHTYMEPEAVLSLSLLNPFPPSPDLLLFPLSVSSLRAFPNKVSRPELG